MPELYAVEWRGVRAATVRKFPFVVYYRIYPESIDVFAVMHGSRDDVEWKARA